MALADKVSLDEVLNHPFTGIYWDLATETYMFFACGILVARLDKEGQITSEIKDKAWVQ